MHQKRFKGNCHISLFVFLWNYDLFYLVLNWDILNTRNNTCLCKKNLNCSNICKVKSLSSPFSTSISVTIGLDAVNNLVSHLSRSISVNFQTQFFMFFFFFTKMTLYNACYLLSSRVDIYMCQYIQVYLVFLCSSCKVFPYWCQVSLSPGFCCYGCWCVE